MSDPKNSTSTKEPEKKAEKMEVDEEVSFSKSKFIYWNPLLQEPLDPEILRMSNDDIKSRGQLMDNEIRIMRSEVQRINHGIQVLKEKIKENNERIKVCFEIIQF